MKNASLVDDADGASVLQLYSPDDLRPAGRNIGSTSGHTLKAQKKRKRDSEPNIDADQPSSRRPRLQPAKKKATHVIFSDDEDDSIDQPLEAAHSTKSTKRKVATRPEDSLEGKRFQIPHSSQPDSSLSEIDLALHGIGKESDDDSDEESAD